jgi:hypothetical protein
MVVPSLLRAFYLVTVARSVLHILSVELDRRACKIGGDSGQGFMVSRIILVPIIQIGLDFSLPLPGAS